MTFMYCMIRIRGSMPLTNGFGSGSNYFRHWPSRCRQKTIFFKKSLLLFEGTFTVHHFSKIRSPKEVTKQYESRFFLLFLLADRRIREAQKHVDPDPDPEHCEEVFLTVKNIASGGDYQWRGWRRGGRWWWRARWLGARSPSRSRRCSRRRPPRRRSAPAPSWSRTQCPPPAGNLSQYLHSSYHSKKVMKKCLLVVKCSIYIPWFLSYFDQNARDIERFFNLVYIRDDLFC